MDELQEPCEFHRPTKLSVVKSSSNSRKRKYVTKVTVPETVSTNNNTWERIDAFQKEWLKIEAKLMNLTSHFFHKYVDKLYNFIVRYSSESQVRPLDANLPGFNYGLLPAALISLNSNMTQIRITNEIEEMFIKNGNDITIIRLNSFNLANMNVLFQTLYTTLLHGTTCEQNEIKRGQWKDMFFDEIFQLWLSKVSHGEGKGKSANNSHTAMVIFVHEFENVNKQNLLKLILILKEYVKQIPILFVFLIHNQLNSSIQNFLPAHATDYLVIEDIQPFYEPKLFPQLLEEFISDPDIYFKIHPNIIQEIYVYFKNYEFSFSNFLFFLKSIVFDYYYKNPLSAICQSSGDLKKILQTNERLLGIFKNSLPLSEKSIQDDKEFIDKLITEYKDLLTRHSEFTLNLKIIIHLLSKCGETRYFLSQYCDIVNKKNFDYKSILLSGLFKVTERTWNIALRKVLTEFEANPDNELLQLLVSYQNKLIDILNRDREEEESQLDSAKKLGLECDIVDKVKILKSKLRNLNSRAEWKQNIAPKRYSRELSLFDKWKIELIDSIHKILHQSAPSKHHHLIDSLFYNREFIFDRHFICVREDIHTSLDQPNRCFKNIYPNSFILYQQYSEASPVINLHDWFELFCEEKRHNKKNISQNELIVHFSSTLSDFDYIGLMQASRYKADYMNKLVWL